MIFSPPLLQGKFLKRYKRFFADIEYHGNTYTAHVANTGSMLGLKTPMADCLFSSTDDPKRKLKHSLVCVRDEKSWVGVNTHLPNRILWEAWEQSQIPLWTKFKYAQKEVKISDHTRIDMVLWNSTLKETQAKDKNKPRKITMSDFPNTKCHFVEIKNVTMAQNGHALFPDATTTRGQKHIKELMSLMKKGHTGELVFLIQRTDCSSFSTADSIDPEYGHLLREAVKAGLKVTPLACKISENSITINLKQKIKWMPGAEISAQE